MAMAMAMPVQAMAMVTVAITEMRATAIDRAMTPSWFRVSPPPNDSGAAICPDRSSSDGQRASGSFDNIR